MAGLIHRQGALSFGGTHVSVLQKSVFVCLRELSEGINVGSLTALQGHQGSWLLHLFFLSLQNVLPGLHCCGDTLDEISARKGI